MMDLASIISTVLFTTSNALFLILRTGRHQHTHFDFNKWKSLEPSYLQYQWDQRMSQRALQASAGLLSALGWFFFCIPIINVAWILSAGGRRRLGLHASIAVLAIGGSISELLARLMFVGIMNVSQWLAKDFNLDNWVNDGSDDGMGWRTLEVTYMVSSGITLWIDAFEWLALFGVLVLIFVSVRADKENCPFGQRWSIFGLVIGILSLFDFAAEVLRFWSWGTFMTVSFVISIINTVILLPMWMLVLGRQLATARKDFEPLSAERVQKPAGEFSNAGAIVHKSEGEFSDEPESAKIPEDGITNEDETAEASDLPAADHEIS